MRSISASRQGREILRRRDHPVCRSQVDHWVGMARVAQRRGNVSRMCEAMLSALWLMGVDQG